MRLSFVMQTPLEYGEGAQRGSREARAFGLTPVFSMTFVCKGSNTVSNVSTQRTFKCAGHIRYGDRMQTGVPCWKITPHSDATCVFSFPLLSLTPGAWVSPPPHMPIKAILEQIIQGTRACVLQCDSVLTRLTWTELQTQRVNASVPIAGPTSDAGVTVLLSSHTWHDFALLFGVD